MNLKHLYIDLDKTLIPYDSFPKFLPALLWHLGLQGLAYSLPIGLWAISGQRPKIRPALANLLKGRECKKLDQFCADWAKQHILKDIRKNLLPPFSFSLASMSMDLIVDPLAEILGAQASLSSGLGREAGKYTGLLSTPQCGGKGKASLIAEDAKKRQLELSEVGLLTDHHRDIPALNIVGYPLLVNPSPALLQWQQSCSAPILDNSSTPDWQALR